MHRDWPLVVRSASLLLGGAAVGLGINSARPSGVALFTFEPPTACSMRDTADASVLEISAQDAADLCQAGGVVFADTRSATRFSEGHVADAVISRAMRASARCRVYARFGGQRRSSSTARRERKAGAFSRAFASAGSARTCACFWEAFASGARGLSLCVGAVP